MIRTALLSVLALIVISASGLPVFAGDDHHGKTCEVTVTNITPGMGPNSGQILNGLVVATHNRHFRLFNLGEPVREELAQVAEDALNANLFAVLSADPNVLDVQSIGIVDPPTIFPILPGDSASVVVKTNGRNRFLTLATMLVTTNDAFAALNGVRLPNRRGSFFALAYDAGSEANTEKCSDIPGPPCGMMNRVGGGEGYVSIHSGIHGEVGGVPSDLNPSERDWRNPVAWVTVRCSRDKDKDDHDDDRD